MSFVAVDLGASSSRYVSDSGQISILPNNMVWLENGQDPRINPDAEDVESSLDISITKDSGAECEYFPTTALAGIMADRFTSVHTVPLVGIKKYKQKVNYVSAIMSAAVSRLKYSLPEDIDLYLAVPPMEIHEAREAFGNQLVGRYTVKFPKYMGGTEVKLNIVSVQCYEESFMASTSFFFNMNGVPKEQNKKYGAGIILSLDIGASTTDLSIIKNGRYLDKSGKTYRVGGNEARETLVYDICSRYDIDLSPEAAEKVMSEGRLQLGNNYVDVSDLVAKAKTELAKKLMTHLPLYFKTIQIDMTTINAIVVSGGGSMQSQYVNADGEVVKTSEPMSYYVTQELLNLSSGTEVVAYGDDARLANVKGLFIKAKVDSITKAAAVKAPAPAPAPASVQAETPTVAQTAPVAPQVTPVTTTTPVATAPVATAPVQTEVPSQTAPVTSQTTPVAPVAPQVTI